MKYRPPRRRIAGGFTLLEILVALAVLAVAVTSVVSAVSGYVSNAAHLRDRTFAHWVAMNKVTEAQVNGQWPEIGIERGDTIMAQREWSWAVKTSATEDADVHRLDVEVYPTGKEDALLANLVAYVGRPLEVPQQ